jgi:hypothetical protein
MLSLFWWHGEQETVSNTIGYGLVKNKAQDRRWKHTLSQASYPTLMRVLLTLQVAIGARVRTRRAWGECKVKYVLLRRRCSLEGKIWWLNKCNFMTEKPSGTSVQSRNSLLGEQMFKVEYDDTKRRCRRKSKQRQNEELGATLEEKHFNGAHHGTEAVVEIQFFTF